MHTQKELQRARRIPTLRTGQQQQQQQQLVQTMMQGLVAVQLVLAGL
jgi:hypothetical protein